MRRYSPEPESVSHAPQTHNDNSSPSNNKITISFPTQVNHYDDDDPTAPIPIYLHAPSKKSVKIDLAAKISVADIKKVVDEMIGIKKDHQLLYLNGKNVTEYGFIRLQAHNIIHILSTDELCSNQHILAIKLTVVSFVSQQQKQIVKNYKVAANQQVNNFIRQVQTDIKSQLLPHSVPLQFYLLQSSRILESDKTFAQQEVGRSTEIVCLITEHQIKTRFTNDTKEQILHDISQLLGFGEDTDSKQAAKPQEKPNTSRYPAYREAQRQQKQKRQIASVQENSQQRDLNDSSSTWNLNASASLPNFKKKADPLSKSIEFQYSPKPLAKKLRASKKKKDLDYLLNSQEKQKFIFESPQVIKEESKQQKPEQIKQADIDVPKPQPQIPKAMPIKERRQIRLEIEKLFDFSDENKSSQKIVETKQEKPISPPTMEVKVIKPEREKMRLSMGSRPAFLDKLRNIGSSE